MDAALAAERSGDVGRYGEMRRAMFGKRGLVEDGSWGVLAPRTGIDDTASIRRCVADHRHESIVKADIQTASQVGIRGIPGIVVNGCMHQGAISLAELEKRLSGASAP